jgi:hypothetical protein
VDDERGRPRYWLAVAEEALGDQDFDLAGKLTPALARSRMPGPRGLS